MMKNLKFILLVILLSIPTFYRMLRPGLYTMQDPVHYFRLVEFDKCVARGEIPCRWAPDAGLGYGEPVFNFYGQASYAIGEVFHLAGLSFVDSLKLLFILSLVGSAISMFFLSKYLWKDNFAALASSVLYIYAPYRAVDVWVRGTLPEALSFVLFPLIILAIEKKSFFGVSFLLFLLIVNHNLSVLLFFPVLIAWILYRRFWVAFPAALLSLVMSAFYLLPLVFESKYVDLQSTTQGYFDFRGHFATLYQLLFSRFWGYGASLFKETDMSRSVGQLQWIIPLMVLVLLVLKKEIARYKNFLLLLVLGWFALFLTHNKSTLVWLTIPPMAYIQFPWRFLGIAVFAFSLAGGCLVILLAPRFRLIVASFLILSAIVFNFSFFREDIWRNVTDVDMLRGKLWEIQIAASIGDFWPTFGHEIPDKAGTGEFINYFPGWTGAMPDKNGLIPSRGTTFTDTPVRRIGNIISLVGMFVFGLAWLKQKWIKRVL